MTKEKKKLPANTELNKLLKDS